MRFDIERIAYPIVFTEQANFKDTYGGPEGLVALESYLVRPVGQASDTVLLFMHPIGGGAYLPIVNALARAGHHVIYANSRYRGIDAGLIMEKVVLDMAAAVRDAKERLGYAKVVLAGWSGGGSLSLYYQEQAEHPSVTSSPAGDPPDLTTADLIPADAVMLMAAHTSRHEVLTESLDPSILDELDPTKRDPELDLYDPANPNVAPYTAEYVARFRAAQLERNRRITAWVLNKLEELRANGRPNDEFGFIVHGTMADPRWLDATIDPNEREEGVSYLGDPQTVNQSPVGLARFSTLRGWLSQWSMEHARADGVRCAGAISVPVLIVSNGADDICVPSHANALYAAVSHADKELVVIPGATHYYTGPGQRPKLDLAVERCTTWLQAHDLCTLPA